MSVRGTAALLPLDIHGLIEAQQNRPGKHQLNYLPTQYLRSPCDFMGLVGNVCPVALPCWVEDTDGGIVRTADGHSCVLRPLPGFAYNPSVIPAPQWLLEAAAPFFGGRLRYIGTNRVPANNKPVRCRNPHTQADWNLRFGDSAGRWGSASDLLYAI